MSQILDFLYGEWHTSVELFERLNLTQESDLTAWNWIQVMDSLVNKTLEAAFEKGAFIGFDGQSSGYLIQWILVKRLTN